MISFKGIGEPILQMRKLIKDLAFRNKQERRLGELQLEKKSLEVLNREVELIKGLDEVTKDKNNAVIHIDSRLFLKITDELGTRRFIFRLSSEQSNFLSQNPKFLVEPDALLERLSK